MIELKLKQLPDFIQNIPSPPKQLFILGENFEELLKRPRVAVVGSRKVSSYGREVTYKLSSELAAQGLVIISGLALGVDAIAHQAALDAGGLTMAVLPNGLPQIYPASHTQLARQILKQGGALITEYPEGMPGLKQNFVARNRLVSGLADGLLITEAAEKSGSLHTARFALEQGREVMAVPGNITSPTSAGCNNLIKTGALPVTGSEDVLHALGLVAKEEKDKPVPLGANEQEQTIIDLLVAGTYDGSELLALTKMETTEFNQTLTMLELSGKIKPQGANHWSLR